MTLITVNARRKDREGGRMEGTEGVINCSEPTLPEPSQVTPLQAQNLTSCTQFPPFKLACPADADASNTDLRAQNWIALDADWLSAAERVLSVFGGGGEAGERRGRQVEQG